MSHSLCLGISICSIALLDGFVINDVLPEKVDGFTLATIHKELCQVTGETPSDNYLLNVMLFVKALTCQAVPLQVLCPSAARGWTSLI